MTQKAKSGAKKRKAYPLRLPPELHSQVAEIAAKEQRTINAQILYVLQSWVEKRGKD